MGQAALLYSDLRGRTEQGGQQENKHGHAEEGRRAEGGRGMRK